MSDHQISLEHANRLVRVTINGDVDIHEGESIVTEARTLAMENKFQLLYDVRNGNVIVNASDWYQLARNLPVLKNVQAHHTRVAILQAPDDETNEFKFYETTAANVGLLVHTFVDEAAAIEWLAAGDEGQRPVPG